MPGRWQHCLLPSLASVVVVCASRKHQVSGRKGKGMGHPKHPTTTRAEEEEEEEEEGEGA